MRLDLQSGDSPYDTAIILPGGTPANPSLQVGGPTQGIYSSGTNDLSVAIAGTQVLAVDAGGITVTGAIAGSSVANVGDTWYLNASIPDPGGVTGYKTADLFPSLATENTVTVARTGTALSAVIQFITRKGYPRITAFPKGFITNNLYAFVDGGVAKLTVQVFKRTLDGTETEITVGTVPNFSNTSVALQTVSFAHNPLGADADTLLLTDLLVFKIRAARVSGPATVNITIYFEGAVNASTAGTTIIQGGPAGYSFDTAIYLNSPDYGGIGDMISIPDGIMAPGSATLTSVTGGFTQAMVNTVHVAEVTGAGPSGMGGPPLLTTVASVQNGNTITLAGTADTATGVYYLNEATVLDPTGSYSGSYIPGVDTMTLTGGAPTTTAVVAVTATEVRDGSLAVVNAGSSGTAGATTLTGTTGVGTKFQATGRITAGGSLDAGSILLSRIGVYTTNPTNLAAEPVTSDAGLTGCTLSLAMNPRSLNVSVQGSYPAPIDDPIDTGAGSSSGATGAQVSGTWASTGRTMIGTNNLTALSNAITAVNTALAAGQSVALRIPGGNYGLWSGSLPISTWQLFAIGDGSGITKFYAGQGVTSAHIFGFSGLFPATSDGTNQGPTQMMSASKRGGGGVGLGFYGNTTATNPVSGIILYDRDDGMFFDDIYGTELRSGLRIGVLNTASIAYARESYFGVMSFHDCGVGGFPSVDIGASGKNANNNNLYFQSLNIREPRNVGLKFSGSNTITNTTAKQITIASLRIEREGGNPGGWTGDLLQFGSATDTTAVRSVYIQRCRLVSVQSGGSAVSFNGTFYNARPTDIQIYGLQIRGGSSFGFGITVNAGYDIDLRLTEMDTRDINVTIAGIPLQNRIGVVGAGSTTGNMVLDASASATDSVFNGGADTLTSTATGTATFAAGVMTVTGAVTTAGLFRVGSTLTAAGLNFGTTITSLGTGAGGNGTYNTSGTQTLGSRAVTSVLSVTRLVTAYVGSTKTATIGALQGSSATWPWAPVAGEAFQIFPLVGAPIIIDGAGAERSYTWNVGANSAPLIQSLIYPTGQPGQTLTIPGPFNFSGILNSSQLQASTTYANDAAAAAGGVAVGQFYRNGSVLQVRIT